MSERQFQIAFERQLNVIFPQYNNTMKLNSDTIFYYLNLAKEQYIKELYRIFQYDQEVTDKLRTLVCIKEYTGSSITKNGSKFIMDYPQNYQFALGEEVYISINNITCSNLKVKTSDVLEGTIETVNRMLENSLSEHILHHNQAKPIRVYTDNKIVLYTDGNYSINKYTLTYLRKAKDIGTDLKSEYTELPSITHQEIVDIAVKLFIQSAAISKTDNKSE